MDAELGTDGPHRAKAGHDGDVGHARSKVSCDGFTGTLLHMHLLYRRGWLTSPRQIENCQVTANVKTVREDQSEYHAVQVAASDRPPKNVTKQMLGHFKRAGVSPKRIVKEFPVTADAHVPIGACILCTYPRKLWYD